MCTGKNLVRNVSSTKEVLGIVLFYFHLFPMSYNIKVNCAHVYFVLNVHEVTRDHEDGNKARSIRNSQHSNHTQKMAQILRNFNSGSNS